jgi:hypothetical protein
MQQFVVAGHLRAAEFCEHGRAAAAQSLVQTAAHATVFGGEGTNDGEHGLFGVFERQAEAQHSRHLQRHHVTTS